MSTIIIIVIIAAICVFAVYNYGKKLRRGGDCCGEHEPAEKKVKVVDRDKSHYPYGVQLRIDGMTCSNCVRRVENAINRLDGTWAKVDLSSRQATVWCKSPPDQQLLREAVRDVGYTVLSVKECG